MTQDQRLARVRSLAVGTEPPANWPGRRIVLDVGLDKTFRTALRWSLMLGNDKPAGEWIPDDATWAAAPQICEALTSTEHLLLVLYAAGFYRRQGRAYRRLGARDMGSHTSVALAIPFACRTGRPPPAPPPWPLQSRTRPRPGLRIAKVAGDVAARPIPSAGARLD
jgi:hypothetical protein